MLISLNAKYHRCSPLYCVPEQQRHFSCILAHPSATYEKIWDFLMAEGAEDLFLKHVPEADIATFAVQMPYSNPRNTVPWLAVFKAELA